MILAMPRKVRDWSAEPPMTNGEVLRMHRENRKERTGLKQTMRATADMLGLHEDTYGSIEYDTRELGLEEARILSSAWKIPVEEFYLPGWRAAKAAMEQQLQRIARQLEQDPSVVSPDYDPHPDDPYRPRRPAAPRLAIPMKEVEVPLVGSVRAGDWQSPMESLAREPIPADQYADDVFVSYCVGDSMHDFLCENDQLVWKLADGRQQHNDVVYAVNENGDVTTKQYKEGPKGPYLHPLNPQYKDMYGAGEEDGVMWRVHGILVARNRDTEGGDTLKLHNPKRLRPK